MKILHITDSHGTVKGPESRKDIYYITFLKKLYELGYVVKKKNIDVIVHTGDLFHTARVSDKFAGQVSEMIKAMGVPFYVVPGNHDIEGYTIDTIDQTKLGLLAKTGVITLLDRDNPIRITGNQDGEEFTVAISGQEYYAHIDEGNTRDYEMQQDDGDLNILAIHGYVTDTPQHPDIKCTICGNIVTDADIILSGHYHRQFEWSDGQNLDVFNPGSMMRVEQTDYNKTHMPHYGILDISLTDDGAVSWDYTFHKFKIAELSTTVFDYSSKYKAKHASITLDGFKSSISNTMASVQTTSNIKTIINDICTQANVDKQVELYSIKRYDDALQSAPDEFEAQPGFIEAQKTKKISKVIIQNFQSHEDTTVDFTDGLNIIVGESNNGKTSILRAIMWVIDNQPLGTDFIMAGKDECSVTICYDDGTSIKRGRTLKDTGYYDIYYYDENGTLQRGNYRGFTNAVPVEVANVHQMPKVNITKDIETHLNVLSQLDGPFLLTESPLVKASAIGRITGTHIVDAAIKDTNKEIMSNKKTVKVLKEQIEEKENTLKGLPDTKTMSEFSNIYTALVTAAYNQDKTIGKLNEYMTNISRIELDICTYQRQYKECTTLLSIKNIVERANKLVIDNAKLDNYMSSVTLADAGIEQYEQEIQSVSTFKSLSPLVFILLRNVIDARELSNKYNLYDNICSQLSTVENDVTLMSSYHKSLDNVVAYAKIEKDYVSKLQPKIDQMDKLHSEQNISVKDIATIKKEIKVYNKNMSKLSAEKNAFIIDNGLCPCCGQHVSEEHIINISTFMEGL